MHHSSLFRSLFRAASFFPLAIAACSNHSAVPAAGARTADTSDAGHERAVSGTASHATTAAPERDTNRVVLSAAAYATAGIAVDTVRLTASGASSGGLEISAQLEFDPARVALISPRTTGRIERLTAVVGDRVAGGQVVGYLSSPDFLTAQADYLQARRRAALLAGTADAEGTAALARASRQRLEFLGAPESAITRLDAGAAPAPLLPIIAPFSGSIVQSMALAGAAVQPGTPIFQIANVSIVNAIAHVPERALSVVHEGQDAAVTVAAYPGRLFDGHVTRLETELDSATRTIKAIVRVPNGGSQLRPGMFATVRLHVSAGSSVAASAGRTSQSAVGTGGLITIPERAVVVQGEVRYVFVQVALRTFERRIVTVVPLTPPGGAADTQGRVIVEHGLSAGDVVVVVGAFTLQSELSKSQLGGDES